MFDDNDNNESDSGTNITSGSIVSSVFSKASLKEADKTNLYNWMVGMFVGDSSTFENDYVQIKKQLENVRKNNFTNLMRIAGVGEKAVESNDMVNINEANENVKNLIKDKSTFGTLLKGDQDYLRNLKRRLEYKSRVMKALPNRDDSSESPLPFGYWKEITGQLWTAAKDAIEGVAENYNEMLDNFADTIFYAMANQHSGEKSSLSPSSSDLSINNDTGDESDDESIDTSSDTEPAFKRQNISTSQSQSSFSTLDVNETASQIRSTLFNKLSNYTDDNQESDVEILKSLLENAKKTNNDSQLDLSALSENAIITLCELLKLDEYSILKNNTTNYADNVAKLIAELSAKDIKPQSSASIFAGKPKKHSKRHGKRTTIRPRKMQCKSTRRKKNSYKRKPSKK